MCHDLLISQAGHTHTHTQTNRPGSELNGGQCKVNLTNGGTTSNLLKMQFVLLQSTIFDDDVGPRATAQRALAPTST